jgi:hypothetical protein
MQRCWEESGLELEKILVEHTDPRRARVCQTARASRERVLAPNEDVTVNNGLSLNILHIFEQNMHW